MSKAKSMYRELDHELVMKTLAKGLALGLERGFTVACAVIDSTGRTRGVLRHEDAGYMTAEFAEGKGRVASSTRSSTQATYDRLQKERPLYGASLAALNAQHGWFLVEGGAPVAVSGKGGRVTIAAVGISGCFPAAVDQEIADGVADWMASQLDAS